MIRVFKPNGWSTATINFVNMPKKCQSFFFLFKNIFTKLFLCKFFLFGIFFSLMQNYLTTFISSQANNGSTILVGTWHKYCLLLPLLGLGFYSKFYWTTCLFFLKYFLVFYKNGAKPTLFYQLWFLICFIKVFIQINKIIEIY